MPLGQLRQDYQPIPTASAPRALGLDVSDCEAVASPALMLQQKLAQGVAAPRTETKWSPRQSVALIVSVSVALWMAILLAGASAVEVAAPLIA